MFQSENQEVWGESDRIRKDDGDRKLEIDADRESEREQLSTENPHDLEGITIIPCINHQILRLALRAA